MAGMRLEDLEKTIRGTVVTASTPDWAEATDGLIWNGRKPRVTPVAIVRAADTADVEAAVRFAAAHKVKVSARSGGHNWSGIAAQDGLVIDLGAINGIRIDAASRLAEVGPGARNMALADGLSTAGLAFPLGHCGNVAAGGYLLGGGLGWNSGQWGIACHAIDSADVVMADGSLIRVSESQNADVFWALRGAGPAFFGIVTRYRLRLQPLPRAITEAAWVYPINRVAEATRWMQACAATMPVKVELSMVMAPAAEPLRPAGKVATVVMVVFADAAEDAAAIIADLGSHAPAGALAIHPPAQASLPGLVRETDTHYPAGLRHCVDSLWSSDPAVTFPGLAAMLEDAPSAGSNALGFVYPARSDVLSRLPAGAFSMVAPAYGIVSACWADPADDALNLAWLRAGVDAVAGATLGHNIGEADLVRPGWIARCYGAEARGRLDALRMAHDPHGVFSGRVVRESTVETPLVLTAP
jgi:FAD/FMN-containing dehydrogenase